VFRTNPVLVKDFSFGIGDLEQNEYLLFRLRRIGKLGSEPSAAGWFQKEEGQPLVAPFFIYYLFYNFYLLKMKAETLGVWGQSPQFDRHVSDFDE
jgi:hypothetical protein